MIVGSLEPIELGGIVVGVLLIVGFIYWRLRQGRIDKDVEKSDDLKP